MEWKELEWNLLVVGLAFIGELLWVMGQRPSPRKQSFHNFFSSVAPFRLPWLIKWIIKKRRAPAIIKLIEKKREIKGWWERRKAWGLMEFKHITHCPLIQILWIWLKGQQHKSFFSSSHQPKTKWILFLIDSTKKSLICFGGLIKNIL